MKHIFISTVISPFLNIHDITDVDLTKSRNAKLFFSQNVQLKRQHTESGSFGAVFACAQKRTLAKDRLSELKIIVYPSRIINDKTGQILVSCIHTMEKRMDRHINSITRQAKIDKIHGVLFTLDAAVIVVCQIETTIA